MTANLRKKLFQITFFNLVFLPVIVLFRLMHRGRPQADLLAELFDFLLAVCLEAGFQAAELLFLGLFGFGFHSTL